MARLIDLWKRYACREKRFPTPEKFRYRFMTKIKLLIAGPTQSGKSTLTTVLTSDAVPDSSFYLPTVGTRIVEVVRNTKLVEIWEIPGDLRYQHLWPVLAEGAVATILVFATDQRNELEAFTKSLPMKNALVIQTGKKTSGPNQPIAGTLGPFNVESPADFREMFDNWLANYVN